MKRCTKCKKEKNINEFNKNISSEDGLEYRCRVCRKEDHQKYGERQKLYWQTHNPYKEKLEKICNICKQTFPIKQFVKNSLNKDGLSRYCKRCQRFMKYGTSSDYLNQKFKEQNKKCGICRTDTPTKGRWSKKWVIDHDHQTKKVRGILCQPCNMALPRIEKYPEWGEWAKDYLNKK